MKSDPDKYYTNDENAPTLVPPMPDSAAVVQQIEAMVTWAEMQRLMGISQAIMVQKLLRTDDGNKQLLLTYILTALARNKHNTFDQYIPMADSEFDAEARRQQDAGYNLRERVRNRRQEDVTAKQWDSSTMTACDSDGVCRLAKGQAIRVPAKQGTWVASLEGEDDPPDAKFCHIIKFRNRDQWFTLCSDGTHAYMDLDHLGFKGEGPNPNTVWYYCKTDDEDDCPPLTSTEADPKPLPAWDMDGRLRRQNVLGAGWAAYIEHFGGHYPVSPIRGAAPLPGPPPGGHWTTRGGRKRGITLAYQFEKHLRFDFMYSFDPDTMRWHGAYTEEGNGRGWCKPPERTAAVADRQYVLYERC